MRDPLALHRSPRRHFAWRRPLLAALGVLILALVFAAYLQPDFVVDLANRIILCL